MNLTEILAQPDGFTPPGIRVRILRIFDQKSGDSEKGPWSFQDIEVEDSSGKGRLKLKNCDELPKEREGKELILTANQSKQHGLTGMKVSHDEYQGTTYHKLIVTPSAQWTWETNGAKPAATQPALRPVPVAQIERTGTEWFGAHLVACAQLAVKVADQLGIKGDDARQACFATLCIDAQRRSVVLDGEEPPEPVTVIPASTVAQTASKRESFIRRICDLWRQEHELGGAAPSDEPDFDAIKVMGINDLEVLGKAISVRVNSLADTKAVGA